MVVVDVYSKRKFVVLAKSKSDTTEELITLIEKEQAATGKKLKELHSDGAGEFINKRMKQFLQSNAPPHKHTLFHTHHNIMQLLNDQYELCLMQPEP